MAIRGPRRSNMPRPRSARDLTMRDAPIGPAATRPQGPQGTRRPARGGTNNRVDRGATRGAARGAAREAARASVSFGGRGEPNQTPEITANIEAALTRRYNQETKILDLSDLGQDADLKRAEFHGLTESHGTKFFKCIMKVCDSFFKTREDKENLIAGIMLGNNGLKDLTPITGYLSLDRTFPDLKAVDLSGNQISKVEDLSRWKYKFKRLEHIVLIGNPIESDLKLARSLVQQFPALVTINNLPIPPEIYMKPTPPKVLPPIFGDVNGLVAKFVTTFFPGFDNERAAMVPYYYDATSKFSYSVNTKSLRASSEPKMLQKGEWSEYTRHSRNLHILNNPRTKIERLHRGVEDITKAFNDIPATRHATFDNLKKWLVECSIIPNVPDLAGTKGGVNGFRIIVHGEYQEVETGKNRSFDRTFILAPGPNEVRIINDMMTVRGYGGSDAFEPDAPEPVQPQVAQVAPVLSEEEQKQKWVFELSQLSGMNLEYSQMCMEQCDWIPDDALASFTAKHQQGQVPAEAFVKDI
ncbi:mrna export factor mex67 [Venturia nashicola]|uniref:Mrna export factor mex67 n=1 Tax=Venturia nashicola TaxID=86259 RepID=A0A4Z1NRX7_9PEZI|nr:mrna export factor mex67 [Venturia nashicola]TLD26305.1 mrna export factor mex67 [Venturia nashicola]